MCNEIASHVSSTYLIIIIPRTKKAKPKLSRVDCHDLRGGKGCATRTTLGRGGEQCKVMYKAISHAFFSNTGGSEGTKLLWRTCPNSPDSCLRVSGGKLSASMREQWYLCSALKSRNRHSELQ